MVVSKKLLYRRGSTLTVHGDDGSPFWICKTNQRVYNGAGSFKAFWFEQESGKSNEWVITKSMDSVPINSVIRETKLKRLSGNIFNMVDSELKKNLKLSEQFVNEKSESRSKKKTSNKKSSKKQSSTKAKAKKISSKVKSSRPKKIKKEKVKVDKTNPNWRLKPREGLTVYEVDPFFESKSMDFPFISTTNYSRLLIRSILLKDKHLFKTLVNDDKKVCSLNIRRSLADGRGPVMFAVLDEDRESLKTLLSPEISKKPRASFPIQLIETVSTGNYNFKSLGIRRVRKIEASRGGREGNNALTKDDTSIIEDLDIFVLANKISCKFVDFMLKEEKLNSYSLLSKLSVAFFNDNCEVALHLLKKFDKYFDFTNLHIEALSAKDWSKGTKGMKEASVKKKGEESITPLHLAALNPNVEVFKALFSVSPDVWVEDSNKRTLVHYAAACTKGIETLKFLAAKSASLDHPDKEGYTPLSIATCVENVQAMEFILSNSKSDEEFLSKNGIGGVDQPLKNSYCPIHLAAMDGKLKSLKVLHKYGVKVDKRLKASQEKLTALMLASARGHLEVVKFLVEKCHAKVETTDKFKRTALTHAVMNGATTVASYLLRLGANPDRIDTSGNSNLHYACAYGWYHCVLLLLEAGAVPDPLNEWKISPCAIAFARGHRGLGEYMLKIPGVCVNFQDSKGRTLLMDLLRMGGDTPTDELYSYVVYLVDKLKINPCLSDVDNKNVLHFLTEFLCSNITLETYSDSKYLKGISKIFHFLIEKGCNPCQMDETGHLPIDYLFNNKTNNLFNNKTNNLFHNKTNNLFNNQTNNLFNSSACLMNYDLIINFIEAMKTDVSRMNVKKNDLGTMGCLISCLRLQHIKELKPICIQLIEFYELLDSNNLLDLRKYCDHHYNLLFDLCKVYANFPSMETEEFKDYSQNEYNHLWEEARSILYYFLKNFKPCLREKVESKEKKGEISAHSILLNASNEPQIKTENPYYKAGFEVLYQFDKDLEAIDHNGTTCLVRSIQSCQINEFRNYISKGANIFVTYPENNPNVYEKQGKPEGEVCLRDPLIASIVTGSFEMFNTLLKNEACIPPKRIPDYPIFITAVNEVLQDRNSVSRMDILEKMISLKDYQNEKTINKFNALHLSVNNSSDDFNINLEIESSLLKYGVNPGVQDIFGRIPLHYAFIKVAKDGIYKSNSMFIAGNGNNLPAIDPIEVASMLMDGMKEKFIDTADQSGSTPLHYASFRGSTVCCMLLMDKGADINRKDKYGNTPLAYAIMGKHEATTITLLQKGADVNCQIFMNSSLLTTSEDRVLDKSGLVNSKFRYLPSHYKKNEKSRFPMTLFEMSLLNSWLGVSYLILERMEKHGLRVAKALEVAYKLQKFQLAKKLMLKQLDNKRLCELVTHGRNLLSSLFKHAYNSDCDCNIFSFIIEHLVKAGNDLRHKDDFGCSALHYASLSNNQVLMNKLFSYSKAKELVNDMDKNGRTPLVAAIWNFRPETSLKLVQTLLENGGNPNVLCHFKKFDYLHNDAHPSTINLMYEDAYDNDLTELSTPLIFAINVKCRPLINLLLEHGSDLKMADGYGRTPLMIAVKSNDLEFVEYFWNACIKVHDDSDGTPPPSKKRKSFHKLEFLVNAIDKQGLNVSHHALFRNILFDGAHDNEPLLRFLVNLGVNYLDNHNVHKVDAVNIAEKMRLEKIYKFLTKKNLKTQDLDNNNIYSPSNFPYNVTEDARAMFDILCKMSNNHEKVEGRMEVDDETDVMSLHDESGNDSGSDESDDCSDKFDNNEENSLPSGLSLSSGTLFKNYTTLLSKVLLQNSYWGMYNFYRMQIWKDKVKDLYVLYTNWGRWGETGNYQNTPFGSSEQAVQEFEKIYKSKSGNEWSKRNEFTPKPSKYRELDIASFVKKSRPKIHFDLKSDVPSKLPVEVQTSVKHISNVSMYSKVYAQLKIDSHVIPFGQIKKQDIMNATHILHAVKKLINEKKSLENKEDAKSQERLHVVYEELQNKSNEYFYLMPVRNVASTELCPIYNESSLDEELRLTSYLLEFEFAERVLLGAQFRKNEMNPLDYIYHALHINLTPMSPQDPISNIILKYIYNSKGARNNQLVDAIFKVSRSNVGTGKNSSHSYHGSHQKLLWHGTKCVNLLSILKNGLIVDPPYAEWSGETFGKGVYTADVYDKSFNYCDQNKNYAYIFLCKTKLGYVLEHDPSSHLDVGDVVGFDNYNSVKALGKNMPLARDELHLVDGLCVPTGKILPRECEYCYLNYNEYVIKNADQISTDYLIRIKVT